MECLASLELQERYLASATKEEYVLPEDLLNCASDLVDRVQRYQHALASHPELATMPVSDIYQRVRDERAPFTRKAGPFRDAELTINDVLVARKIPAVAIPAVDAMRRAIDDHPNVIQESPSWTSLVRESKGWALIREATRTFLEISKSLSGQMG